MNTTFNSALKQSATLRKDLAALSAGTSSDAAPGSPPATLTPAALGALSASLTAFARTLDDYHQLARHELNPAKQEKALDRIRTFRTELAEYRARLDELKAARDDAVQSQNRAELLGRRPYVSATPENPYASASSSSYGLAGGGGGGGGGTASRTAYGGGGIVGSEVVSREAHVVREQNFLANTHAALDEFIARGGAVLEDLGHQRETMKSIKTRMFSVANTLGLSGHTIRMIDRRARQDKWIFWAGVVVFFLFCWLVLHYLR